MWLLLLLAPSAHALHAVNVEVRRSLSVPPAAASAAWLDYTWSGGGGLPGLLLREPSDAAVPRERLILPLGLRETLDEAAGTTLRYRVTGAGLARDVYDDRDDWVDGGVALCFGSEAHGLSDELLAAADLRVTVPQAGLTQSLNVASCAALVLGEVLRRRTFAPLGDGERAALEAAALAPPVRLHNKASLKREMRENAHAMKTAREVYD